MSKDVKPKQRIGKHGLSNTQRAILWSVLLVLFGGGGYAAYYYGTRTVVEVAVARVRRSPFVLAVRTRGEVRSTRSITLSAPQVPNLRIVTLVSSGRRSRKATWWWSSTPPLRNGLCLIDRLPWTRSTAPS